MLTSRSRPCRSGNARALVASATPRRNGVVPLFTESDVHRGGVGALGLGPRISLTNRHCQVPALSGPEICCARDPWERRDSRISREIASAGPRPDQVTDLLHGTHPPGAALARAVTPGRV